MSFLKTLMPPKIEGAISKNWSSLIAWGFGLGICITIAPYILSAIGGLLGVLIGGAIAWGALKMAPAFGLMLGNATLKLIKYEARQNPVETMQGIYQERQSQIDADEKMAAEFNQGIEAYKPVVRNVEREFPEDAKMFVEHLAAMIETKEMVYAGISDAKVVLKEYARQIKRADAIWQATKTGNQLAAFAGRIGRTEAMQQIKNDAAIQSIQDRMASSFSNLDILRRQMADKRRTDQVGKAAQAPTASLSNNASPVIDVTPINTTVKVPR